MSIEILRGSPWHRRILGITLSAGAVVLLVAPHVLSEFRTFQATLIMIWALGALGTNLLVGYGGQISLAFNSSFAIGAYTTGFLTTKHAWPYLLTLPMGAVVAFLLGLGLGRITGRLRGLYLAMATLSVALIVPQIAKRWESVTGGNAGTIVATPRAPEWSGMYDDQWRYYLVLMVCVPMFLLARNLVTGQPGRSLIAIRDGELVAGAMGVNTPRAKASAVGLSACYAAVCGSLYVLNIGIIAPESVTIFISVNMLVAIVVGGLGTIGGAVVGGAFLQLAPSWTSSLDERLGGVFYGLLVILFLMLAPKGIGGSVKALLATRVKLSTPTTGSSAQRSADPDLRADKLVVAEDRAEPQRTPRAVSEEPADSTSSAEPAHRDPTLARGESASEDRP